LSAAYRRLACGNTRGAGITGRCAREVVGRVSDHAQPSGGILGDQLQESNVLAHTLGYPVLEYCFLGCGVDHGVGLAIDASQERSIAEDPLPDVGLPGVRGHPYECLGWEVIRGRAYQSIHPCKRAVWASSPSVAMLHCINAGLAVYLEGRAKLRGVQGLQ
jgi:hypothetical protein